MSGAMDAALSVARELRRLPVLRGVYEKTDPRRRAHRLVKSGIIDPRHYAAQLGVDELTVEEAAHHYVTWGHWAGLTINGLLDDRVLRRSAPPSDRPPAYDYLWTKSWRSPVSPFWDVADYKAGGPQPSFDKQYVRDWLSQSGWDRRPPAPPLPGDIVAGTSARYAEAYRRLTGLEVR